MDLSLGWAQITLGSARIFEQKALLGSGHAIFQKAHIEKIGKNEPILGLETVIKICLEIESKDHFFFFTMVLEGYFLSKNWSKKAISM